MLLQEGRACRLHLDGFERMLRNAGGNTRSVRWKVAAMRGLGLCFSGYFTVFAAMRVVSILGPVRVHTVFRMFVECLPSYVHACVCVCVCVCGCACGCVCGCVCVAVCVCMCGRVNAHCHGSCYGHGSLSPGLALCTYHHWPGRAVCLPGGVCLTVVCLTVVCVCACTHSVFMHAGSPWSLYRPQGLPQLHEVHVRMPLDADVDVDVADLLAAPLLPPRRQQSPQQPEAVIVVQPGCDGKGTVQWCLGIPAGALPASTTRGYGAV